MGCNTSRLDALPAVALCRDRCNFLDEALRQSYAVADAHVAHMESLKTLGPALHAFFLQFERHSDSDNCKSNQPLKSTPLATSQVRSFSSSSSSDSDSHAILHSESEAEDTERFFNPSRYDSSPPDNVAFLNYPPPSPPTLSSAAWDFLNLFESFEKYQVPYSPGREDTEVKEKKKKEEEKEKKSRNKKDDGVVVDGGENGEAKKEAVSGVKKSIWQKEEHSNGDSGKVKSTKGLSEAMKEIQILFQRASDSGKPILQLLDVGKLRYHQNLAVNPAPCKMMHVFTPSSPCMDSSLVGRGKGSGYQVDMDKGINYGNLCSTLKKLCMWEKKLYDEVKAEEKLRMLHEKKCKQLRRMNKKGADAHKVDSVQTLIGILATKIKISFQVVDKISNSICKLREEELWPQINSYLFRLLGMWKEMLECYRCQYKEIAEARSLDGSSFNRMLSNSHLDEVIKLKSEIQNWNLSFSDWIYAQKSHVKALNGWLVRCLLYDPEEIPDGTASFSPGRLGAPPVFVICTKWSRAMDSLTEKDVIEAVNGFILRVNKLLETHMSDLQQKLTLDKELERKVRMLERQEQKMHKVVQVRERKMAPNAREESVAPLKWDGEPVDTACLQSGLKHIFAAMESFTAITARIYEELCQQIEQDGHVLGEFNIC